MSDAATCAGAISAESDMIVSGGNVTIKGSTAHYDGGRGSGSLALSRNRGRGIPLKKWHKEGHGLCSLGRRVLRVQGLRALQADAAPAVTQQVMPLKPMFTSSSR